MQRFLTAGRSAIESGNTLSALFVALSLPDICGAIIKPGAKNGERFREFAETWLGDLIPKMITAAELYALRNSLIHAGSNEIDRSVVSSFVLVDRPEYRLIVRQHGNTVNGVELPGSVIIGAPQLCEVIFRGVEQWMGSPSGEADINRAQANLITLHSGGVSVIG